MIIEVCAESYKHAINAEKARADRIELCKDLHLDGLTPDYDTAKKTIDELNQNIKDFNKYLVQGFDSKLKVIQIKIKKIIIKL